MKEENPWLHELRHLYGAGILLFYYAKWPILIGWPVMRFVLEYKDNWIIDALWVWCLILVFKDLYVWLVLKESYCESRSCQTKEKKKESDDGDHSQNEGQ